MSEESNLKTNNERMRTMNKKEKEAFSAVFEGPHWPYQGDGSKTSRLAYLAAREEEIRLARAYVLAQER